ncbi:hypothetical protein SSP35_04_00340 [Streptomyces sp. NBRC 110611]|nr:hypothetical protein SSP35_04_00340 [Streptomyces sp. NBRC 110611]
MGLLSTWRALERATRPYDPEFAEAMQRRWAELPAAARTPGQIIGRHGVGCEGTHGVFPKCNLKCTPCYHSRDANQVRVDGLHTREQVAAQMGLLRKLRGPRAHTQLIGGEVSLLPPDDHAAALAVMRAHGRPSSPPPSWATNGAGRSVTAPPLRTRSGRRSSAAPAPGSTSTCSTTAMCAATAPPTASAWAAAGIRSWTAPIRAISPCAMPSSAISGRSASPALRRRCSRPSSSVMAAGKETFAALAAHALPGLGAVPPAGFVHRFGS